MTEDGKQRTEESAAISEYGSDNRAANSDLQSVICLLSSVERR